MRARSDGVGGDARESSPLSRAFSDGDFSPEGSPRKVALSGDGPLITGAAVRRALRPADALGGTLGGASKPPEPTNGSA